jgi:PPP family 3-phenylpropionic acid transporter
MIEPVYFFYFLSVGVSMPFLPPFLRGLGLTGRQIATILSVLPLLNVGLPFLWAWTADQTRRHARVLAIAYLGAGLAYAPLAIASGFSGAFISYAAAAIFLAGIGSLLDALAIARVRAGADYGRIRVWGSAGYILSAVGMGAVLTARGDRPGDRLVPVAISATLLGAFAIASRLRVTGEAAGRPRLRDVRTLLGDRRLRLLLTVAPLHWIGCAPYNIFFGIFVRDRHLSPLVLGAALSMGVVAEMLVLLGFSRLRAVFSVETLLVVAFAGTSLRWMLMPLVARTGAIVGLQLFHGLTFGLFWGAGIAWIGETVPPSLRATGQSLFVMSMLGVGNVLGYLVTGWVYDVGGSVGPAFVGASLLELVPLVLVIRARRLHGRGGGAAPPPAVHSGSR